MMIDEQMKKQLIEAQTNEITEYHIYMRLSGRVKDARNSSILRRIAKDERRHYHFWKKYTGIDVRPSKWKIRLFYLISIIFGITFGIKLMEKGEEGAQFNYERIAKKIPGAKQVLLDEDEHERKLIEMIDEERLRYTGSVVLGLNDALVELTGALAGFTFALQNARLIGMVGSITGIAAAMSMGASEYLSTKSEKNGKNGKNPVKASLYTGSAYIITVILLIIPFLMLENVYLALAVTVGMGILVIFLFTYYISIAKDFPFWRRFLEMAGLSIGIAGISFLIGIGIRSMFNVDI